MQRWAALCFKSGRGEVVVQVVAERATPALRIDNLLHAWRKLIAKILPDGVSAKQLKRGGWFADAFLDIKIMAEAFDAGIGKLRAEAAAVDSAALGCSFTEPALPSESSAAPSVISEQPRPSAVPTAAPAAQSGRTPTTPAPMNRAIAPHTSPHVPAKTRDGAIVVQLGARYAAQLAAYCRDVMIAPTLIFFKMHFPEMCSQAAKSEKSRKLRRSISLAFAVFASYQRPARLCAYRQPSTVARRLIIARRRHELSPRKACGSSCKLRNSKGHR